MSTDNTAHQPLEAKAVNAVIEELERQAAERPHMLTIRRLDDKITVNGHIDVDAIVMVVVGSMAGGP